MELSERNKLVIARVENFNYILRTAMFVLLGTLALGIFAEDKNTRSDTFYRWFNEFPVPVLIGIIILAVVKPF